MYLGRGRKRLKGHCGKKAVLARSYADDKITWIDFGSMQVPEVFEEWNEGKG